LLSAALLISSAAATIWVLWLGGLSTITSLIIGGAEYLLQFPSQHSTQLSWLAGFAVISLSLQLLIVPSGSILLIGAGFVFGLMPSVGIYTLMQCLAIWPIYWLCQYGSERNPWALQHKVDRWLAQTGLARVTDDEPLVASMVLRLTPVLPSAAASSVASFSGVPISAFFAATVLVGWVRPLFFASIGGAAKELSGFATALNGDFHMAPLIMVFLAVLVLLVVRLWMRHRAA